MTTTSVHPAIEANLIHAASCRYRVQGLACSTCSELAERAARVRGWFRCSCGSEDYLIRGLCEPCRVGEAA